MMTFNDIPKESNYVYFMERDNVITLAAALNRCSGAPPEIRHVILRLCITRVHFRDLYRDHPGCGWTIVNPIGLSVAKCGIMPHIQSTNLRTTQSTIFINNIDLKRYYNGLYSIDIYGTVLSGDCAKKSGHDREPLLDIFVEPNRVYLSIYARVKDDINNKERLCDEYVIFTN